MTITRTALKTIREEIDSALEQIAIKHGLSKLRCGSGTFGNGHFTLKVEGLEAGGLSFEEEAYDANAKWLGLPSRGTPFKLGSKPFTVFGLKGRSDKVLCKGGDGKLYKVSVDAIKRALPAVAP